MDILGELESMVANAEDFDRAINCDDDDPADESPQSEKWTRLFGYTIAEAQGALERLESGLDPVVSRALWETVRERQDLVGHDRLTYSHMIRQPRQGRQEGRQQPPGFHDNVEYLVQLGGPMDSPRRLADLLGEREVREVLTAHSLESGLTTYFCCIPGSAKAKLLSSLSLQRPGYSPLIVSSSYAKKELCSHSWAPSIGVDCTLPQNRLNDSSDASPLPLQGQYPVWYFFYGTLCDTNTLSTLFAHLDGEDTKYTTQPARITGGRLGTCGGGKYNALVDASTAATVDGRAFLVTSKEHEDALCFFETSMYDVARCKIELTDSAKVVYGCTFRYIGLLD